MKERKDLQRMSAAMMKVKSPLKNGDKQQQRAEKRTRKSELIGEFGRGVGKAKFKAENASLNQEMKARYRTDLSESLADKDISMNKRGYAKRRTVEKSGSVEGGDYMKTVTTRSKEGDIKKVKTTDQITRKKKYGAGAGSYVVQKQTKIPSANYSSEPKYTKKGTLGQFIIGVGGATVAGLMGAEYKKTLK